MSAPSIKEKVFIIIFGHNSPAGKWFDLILIFAILLSVFAISLDSVAHINLTYGTALLYIEWFFTIIFTIEYLVRIWCTPKRFKYIFSFYGIIDLLSVLPTYLSFIFLNVHYLLILRLLRVLRIFRILKLFSYVEDSRSIAQALWAAHRKILIFFYFVLVIATIIGSIMYLVEGPQHGFTSIPKSIYWAIVTITTVGYGDITPHTILGQIIANFAMIIGYAIIAVPTSIITVEMAKSGQAQAMGRYYQQQQELLTCPSCTSKSHNPAAQYCYNCGDVLVK